MSRMQCSEKEQLWKHIDGCEHGLFDQANLILKYSTPNKNAFAFG